MNTTENLAIPWKGRTWSKNFKMKLPEEILDKRMSRLIREGHLTPSQADEFYELNAFMKSDRKREEFFTSFKKTDDRYKPLLERILVGMMNINEPFAMKKYNDFLAEKGTMSVAGYLTQWELTLSDLDASAGHIEEIIKFYSD